MQEGDASRLLLRLLIRGGHVPTRVEHEDELDLALLKGWSSGDISHWKGSESCWSRQILSLLYWRVLFLS